MGFLEVLTIVFVVLKLVGVIAWSWWAVFIPMYVAVAFYAIVIVIQIKVWNREDEKHDKFMNNFRRKKR